MGRRTVEEAARVLLDSNYPCAGLLTQALDLYKNAKRGKHKHFHAAERLEWWAGVLTVLTSTTSALSAVLVALKTVATESSVAQALPLSLVFVVSLFSAGAITLQNTMTLRLKARAHRDIGNQYIEVSRRAETVVASFIDSDKARPELDRRRRSLEDRIEMLMTRYASVNAQAESWPTNKRDSRAARDLEKRGGSQIPIVAQLVGQLAGGQPDGQAAGR